MVGKFAVSYTHLDVYKRQIYDDAGQLFPIETPEEWEMVEEVFQSFMAESEEGHECCGNHGNGCCHDNDEEHECCGNHGDCNCDN